VQSAPGRRAVEPADEFAVLGLNLLLVSGLHRRLQPFGEGLRGRLVAQVLEPLLGGCANALLLCWIFGIALKAR
jgi:hypothetical protein